MVHLGEMEKNMETAFKTLVEEVAEGQGTNGFPGSHICLQLKKVQFQGPLKKKC